MAAKSTTNDLASDSSDTNDDGLGETVVVEFGSAKTRAGFAGKDERPLVLPSVIGRPRNPETKTTCNGVKGETKAVREASKDVYFGDEAMSRPRSDMRLRRPVEWGIVTSFDELELLWKHVLHEKLGCRAENTPLLMVEGEKMNPKANREKLTQLAFETFNLPEFCLVGAPPLVLGAAGRTTGLVVDISDSVVRAVPVYEGYPLPHAVMKFPLGSDNFSDHLAKLLAEKGFDWSLYGTSKAREMKERFAYVAQNYDDEIATFNVSQEKQFQLPSGETITLGPERFQCVEPLFRPPLIGFEMWGLAEHVVRTVKKCDVDIRDILLGNVVLAGGGSMVPGLASRLQHEIGKELQGHDDMRKLHVQVMAPPEGDILAWKGGSIVASCSAFHDLCISSAEYDEYGPNLVHRKCFA